MRFIICILLTAILAYALGLYLPWWSIAISSFVIAVLIPQKTGWAFVSAFVSILLFWGIMSWVISSNNDHILAHRVSALIIKTDSPGLLIFITALLGAFTAGLAGLTGNLFRGILLQRR
jgi:hypothetical protein